MNGKLAMLFMFGSATAALCYDDIWNHRKQAGRAVKRAAKSAWRYVNDPEMMPARIARAEDDEKVRVIPVHFVPPNNGWERPEE